MDGEKLCHGELLVKACCCKYDVLLAEKSVK